LVQFDDVEIIYQDDYLIAINKPNGLFTHRTPLSSRDDAFALQILRNKIGRKVNPVHRLDRKTSGILLFSFSADITKKMQEKFITNGIVKKYYAIVRGFFPSEILVDYPVINARNKLKSAQTTFKNLIHYELDLPMGRFQTSRYSFIEAIPHTGRMHQIRRHCNHLRHPIIGDRPHGCNKQNKLFKNHWGLDKMLLHARHLEFGHPVTDERVNLSAEFPSEFERVRQDLELQSIK